MRTIWVFPDDGQHYRIEIPYGDHYAEELFQSDGDAWQTLLGVLNKMVNAGRSALD